MKLPQILMIIGLLILLIFSIPVTWADKKTAIIAGSAGGGAVAVIGGALWYKLRNYNGKVEVTIDGEKLAIENSDPKLFNTDLLEHGINSTTVEELENKIDSTLPIEEKETNEIETASNKVKILKIAINTNGKEIKYTVAENNELLIEGSIDSSEDKDDEKASEISSTELNETPGNLGIIDQNKTPDQPKTSTDTENIDPYTESTNVMDTAENLENETGNLEEVVTD